MKKSFLNLSKGPVIFQDPAPSSNPVLSGILITLSTVLFAVAKVLNDD